MWGIMMRTFPTILLVVALALSRPIVNVAHAADVQVKAADNNAPNLGNFTTES
jgi:hypothetical protein